MGGYNPKENALQNANMATLFESFGTKRYSSLKNLGKTRIKTQTMVERRNIYFIQYSKFDKI
jgi:hypothetical protein